MAVAHAYINRIGTARPQHEVHGVFVEWAEALIGDTRRRALFQRVAMRAGIDRRWSVLAPAEGRSQTVGGFYAGRMPSTAARMHAYAEAAPDLAEQAVAALGTIGRVSHIVVASCTGFVAPGLDQILARRLGLAPDTARTFIGFMGCYAAVVALRTAATIVRADPKARVLVVAVELCTLHLQASDDIESLLAMLQFGDGAAAALVTGEPEGLELTRFASQAIGDSTEQITWTIGDEGFVMQLAGAVPATIAAALGDPDARMHLLGTAPVDAWAVHPGGRSVLDAVERALSLPDAALQVSRDVLREAGNMSSATLLFVLRRILEGPRVDNGIAMAFGPGVAAEAFGFRSAA